jgi:hypothetical protein
MKALSNLLSRLKLSLDSDLSAKESIVSCLTESVGFALPVKDVSLKEDRIEIKTSPTKKNEIMLHEKEILEKVRARTDRKVNRVLYL